MADELEQNLARLRAAMEARRTSALGARTYQGQPAAAPLAPTTPIQPARERANASPPSNPADEHPADLDFKSNIAERIFEPASAPDGVISAADMWRERSGSARQTYSLSEAPVEPQALEPAVGHPRDAADRAMDPHRQLTPHRPGLFARIRRWFGL